MPTSPLRRLRWRLAVLVVVYFFAGAASQKLIPGIDEIIPFYGWSLFSKIPNEDSRYTLLVQRHKKRAEPPVSFQHAPDSIVKGNRYTGRKVIQRLGKAVDKGDAARVAELRRLLEQSHLHGRVRYELIFERYDPVQKWRTGANLERRSVAKLIKGEGL